MNKKTIIRIITLIMATVMMLSAVSCKKEEVTPPDAYVPTPDTVNDNFRTFYQIFVGSFSDSNGDGIGDIRGIINRFDYLNDGDMMSQKSLGVQGIWLSPIFTSPSYHKYDAKDYYKIDWRFGNEADLKELAELCHSRNVKLILDLAINHTSSQHEWFLKFKEARMNGYVNDPYYDYYSTVTTAEKQGGISYGKIAGVDCWYECNFSGDMPELNFDNPEVRQATLDIAKHYMELGVDGFRFDAVKYIYLGNTAKTVEFWDWYMGELRASYPDIYAVGECWSGETEILDYYGAMNCFNFASSQAEGVIAAAAKGTSISKYLSYMVSYQKKTLAKNPDSMVMSFLSNHDMDRIAGAFVTENYMKMAANLYLLSMGSPTIYYGEEIGMRGSRGSANTDANRRLGMLWGDSDGIKDPVGTTYPAQNQIKTTVASQLEDENSMLRYYCKLLSIRHKHEAIARGTYTAAECGQKNFGGFLVEYKGEALGIFHNTGSEEISYDLSGCSAIAGRTFDELCDYIGMSGARLEGTTLIVGPQTSVIIK